MKFSNWHFNNGTVSLSKNCGQYNAVFSILLTDWVWFYELEVDGWSRYKEVVHEDVDRVSPQEILATLAELETKIQQGLKELEAMLG